ncbi:hypothetical protein F5888DRAFT_1890516 [Russula emetica]|nr:hypothetical protein F5888DRAFT_1890516 [Russula emetica]
MAHDVLGSPAFLSMVSSLNQDESCSTAVPGQLPSSPREVLPFPDLERTDSCLQKGNSIREVRIRVVSLHEDSGHSTVEIAEPEMVLQRATEDQLYRRTLTSESLRIENRDGAMMPTLKRMSKSDTDTNAQVESTMSRSSSAWDPMTSRVRQVLRYGRGGVVASGCLSSLLRNSVKRNRRDGRAKSVFQLLLLRVWTYRRCPDPNQLSRPEKEKRLEGESGEEERSNRERNPPTPLIAYARGQEKHSWRYQDRRRRRRVGDARRTWKINIVNCYSTDTSSSEAHKGTSIVPRTSFSVPNSLGTLSLTDMVGPGGIGFGAKRGRGGVL